MNQERIYDIVVTVLSNSFIVGQYQLSKINKYQKLFGIDKVREEEKNLKEKVRKRKHASIKDGEIQEKITEFKKVLEKNFNIEDIINFYNNTEWLKITIVNNFKDLECYGIYNANKNLLLVKRDNINDALFHELFHLASSKLTLKYKRTGFLLDYKKDCIGYGLNEGYTELLTRRYFNEESNSYLLEQNIASNLEVIVGKKKMESLYLNADLYGLTDILKKYYSIEEIEKFLLNLDVYTCYFNERQIVSKKLESKMIDLIQDMNLFLIKGYLKHLKEKQSMITYKNIINLDDIICYLQCFYYKEDNSEILDRINGLMHSILGKDYSITSEDLELKEKGECL